MNTLSTTSSNGLDHRPTPPSIKPVTEAVAQETQHLGEMAKHLWSQGSDRARHTVQTVRDEAAAAQARTRQYVRDEPMKSVLLAVAGGALLAGLFALLTQRGR